MLLGPEALIQYQTSWVQRVRQVHADRHARKQLLVTTGRFRNNQLPAEQTVEKHHNTDTRHGNQAARTFSRGAEVQTRDGTGWVVGGETDTCSTRILNEIEGDEHSRQTNTKPNLSDLSVCQWVSLMDSALCCSKWILLRLTELPNWIVPEVNRFAVHRYVSASRRILFLFLSSF